MGNEETAVQTHDAEHTLPIDIRIELHALDAIVTAKRMPPKFAPRIHLENARRSVIAPRREPLPARRNVQRPHTLRVTVKTPNSKSQETASDPKCRAFSVIN